MDAISRDRLNTRRAEFDDLRSMPIGVLAKRDGLSFKDTQNTSWWQVMLDENETVAVFGVIRANSTTARLKSIYVMPEWRRMGILGYCGDMSVRIASSQGFDKIVAIVRPNSKAGLVKSGWSETQKHNLVEKVIDG